MDNKLRQLHTDIQNIRLHAEERSRMRTEILAFVHAHPVKIPAWRLVGFFIKRHATTSMALFLALAGITAGSLAETAIPGDLLYSVKTDVTEKTRDALTFSNEGKIEWDIQKAERRQQEDETLAYDLGI